MTYFYFHGFGVDKTDRGLFTYIAANFPRNEHIFTPFNKQYEKGLIQSTISEQVGIVKNTLKNTNFDKAVIMAHSQGCVAAANALVNTNYPIEKVILLTPPSTSKIHRFINNFRNRPGAVVDLNGESTLPRRDGTITKVSAECIKEMEKFYAAANNAYASIPYPTIIIKAGNDEVLVGANNFDELDLEIINLQQANHDFTGDSRQSLLRSLEELLV